MLSEYGRVGEQSLSTKLQVLEEVKVLFDVVSAYGAGLELASNRWRRFNVVAGLRAP